MGSFEVVMHRREVLEERDIEVMPIDVRIRREHPVVDRVRVEQVTRGRIAGLKLLPFIGGNIPSAFHRSTPTSSATEKVKEFYLPNMVSGAWTGVMELTESQACNELNRVNTKAMPQDNGNFTISGEKIFIAG